ncbi:hypothetical protein [Clostridium isatidis]|uniref:Pilus assembly protein PilO n=1 Tax=Clostridium isatidis TaxID=182773 RepID=A0A343J9T7_9CLOT|nr:hypothetical protein [Clostridium isatidis]ASW42295.1 hypothetical protein BEN51_01960 [Clostridium isatidis]
MNISKREKYLIGIFLAVLICFVYYQFVYTKQVEKLKVVRAEKESVEERYNDVMKAIANLDAMEEEFKILKANVLGKSEKLYPVIMQEKIIIELDELLNDSGLNGNIAFSPIEVSPAEKLVSPEIKKTESSLKAFVDEYNGNVSNTGESSSNSANGQGGTNQENSTTTEQLKVAINFSGSYEALKSFIASLQNYERKIVIPSISITAQSEVELTGVMNLEFHAVPKIDDQDIDYLIWSLNNIYGKEILFSSGEASGAYASTIEEQSSEQNVNDFVMMLKSPSSELPTVTIGKAKDDSRGSYIYSDNDGIEAVEISFEEVDGNTFFKYKTTTSYYPKDNSPEGMQFIPKSENIVLEILSENRVETSDNSGINLKVINNTSKKVEVIIKNDDSSNPRVSVTSEGYTVNVTKK